MKQNKINININNFDLNDFDYENFSYGFIKMSKPGGKINTSKKSRPNYKGHQASIRKGGKR